MSLILDPTEIAQPGRVELNLLSDTIYAKPEGIDWGDTALENFKAQQTYGEAIVDWRLPNRVVTIPLIVRGRPEGETMIEAMGRLQAKVARLATEGGALKRVRGGLTMYADIETAHLVLPDTWTGENRDFETEGQIILECRPDFYGAEAQLTTINGVGSLAIGTISGVLGSYPARTRIVIEDEDTQTFNGAILGFRPASDSPTAALMYEAEALEPLGGASAQAVSGSSDGEAVRASVPLPEWQQLLRFRLGGADYLTHVGTYRVWARVKVTGGSGGRLRLAWSVNSIDRYTFEPEVALGGNQFELANLGVVRLQESPMGGQRWDGVIQARSADSNGLTVDVDRIELQPLDATGGRITVPPATESPISNLILRDSMFHSAGNLTGKTLSGVGTYAVHPSSEWQGSPDFVVDTAEDLVERTVAAEVSKRAVGFPAGTISEKNVRAALKFKVDLPYNFESGLILRSVDATDYVYVRARGFNTGLPPYGTSYRAYVYSGGGVQEIASSGAQPFLSSQNWNHLVVDLVDDTLTVYINDSVVISTQHAALNLVGAGGAYIADNSHRSTHNITNRYKDFELFSYTEASAKPCLVYPDRSLEITSQGVYRESLDGGFYDRVPLYGALPRLPVVSGDGEVEMFARMSVGALEAGGDDGLFSPSAKVFYRPCWSSVPEEISAGGSGSGSGSGS